jgi:hypothetical protein
MQHTKRLWLRSPGRVVAAALLVATAGAVGRLSSLSAPAPSHAASVCQVGGPTGQVKHVIYLQFDNFHFKRDNPNVPSDLEQTPALLNFIKSNGVLLTNHHTSLISHTADDFITSFTGLYGARQGIATSHNSYRYWNPDGSTSSVSAFQYWTDNIFRVTGGSGKPVIAKPNPISPNPDYNLLDEGSNNTPAPWVPFTRNGCDFAAVGGANLEIENTNSDLGFIFGPNSPQALEGRSDSLKAEADYEGIAVHCALNSAFCNQDASDLQPDILPTEPGGYQGYQALFGAKYVTPLINPAGRANDPSCVKNPTPPVKFGGQCLADLNGNLIADSYNGETVPGFPYFDSLTPAVTLSYMAAMQEHGLSVTYGYLTHAHEDIYGNPFGPGQAEYEAYLKDFNNSFVKFFARLAQDNITPQNTLFIFTTDEEDHFGGAQLTNCNGVSIPCVYGPNQLGELSTNLSGLTAQAGNSTKFDVQNDVAPSIYIHNDAPNVNVNQPAAPADAASLALARTFGSLTATNLYTGKTDQLIERMADPLEMQMLHMVSADGARTPNLNLFGNDYYYLNAGPSTCGTSCVSIYSGYAWIHGSYQPAITNNWLGFVGPGVKNMGQDSTTWTDETDIRPSMITLLGLQDDYAHQGRVISEVLDPSIVPAAMRRHLGAISLLGQLYKQVNAPLGLVGRATLSADTAALEGSDSQYAHLYTQLNALLSARDTLVQLLQPLVDSSAYEGGTPGTDSAAARTSSLLSPQHVTSLIVQAHNVLRSASTLAQ